MRENTDPNPSLGGYHFSRAVLPLLLETEKSSPQYPPTLIFTSATAAMRGGALFSSFSTGKFAMRSLSQSLAREFGPKGVHVVHAIIDGVIDIPRTKEWKFDAPDAKISPESVSFVLRIESMEALTGLVRLRTLTGTCIRNHEHHLRMNSILDLTAKSGRYVVKLLKSDAVGYHIFNARFVSFQPLRKLHKIR